MKDVNIDYLSASDLGRAVNNKQLSPVEIIDYCADRIEKRNPSINAFVYTKIDEAKEEAKKLEKRILDGEDCGPFAGVPFALKDFLPSKKGWTHSHGGVKCFIKEDPESSEFCKAMEKAGGIAVGKTNSPAFGFRGTCDNKMYGPTSTPFNIEYNSGGSSGGSASAVADGLVPIAEGGDAGGSIRIPAAWCGCYGFKASVGTVPSVCRPDAWAATHPFCHNGGITRTVEDSAILMNYMGHYDSKDPFSRHDINSVDFVEAMNKSIKGYKIGFTKDFNLFKCDNKIAEIVEKAARRFEEAGAVVDYLDFDSHYTTDEISKVWCQSLSIDSAIEFELMRQNGIDLIKDHPEDFPEQFVYWLKKATFPSIMDYYMFHKIRTDLYDAQDKAFSQFDLIISPTASCFPVKNGNNNDTTGPSMINGQPVDPLIGFAQTYLFNFTGNPAASIPAGFGENNLPIGMQIIGRRFDDESVFAASHTFEQLQPWAFKYREINKRLD